MCQLSQTVLFKPRHFFEIDSKLLQCCAAMSFFFFNHLRKHFYSFSQLLWHIFLNNLNNLCKCNCLNCLLKHQNTIAYLQKIVTHSKHLIHASKPSYCVIYLANATKIKSIFVIVRAPHWSKCLDVFFFYHGNMLNFIFIYNFISYWLYAYFFFLLFC